MQGHKPHLSQVLASRAQDLQVLRKLCSVSLTDVGMARCVPATSCGLLHGEHSLIQHHQTSHRELKMQMLAYLESYVDHFGFRKQITFRTQVVSVIPQLKGGFTVFTKVGNHP